LASGSYDKTIKLWEVASGREVRTLSGHTWDVTSVAFSPDGRLLASGSYDNTIKLWDVASGREVRTLSGHTEGVTSVAFSPDGAAPGLRLL
jgi:WD40 repeat protein